MRCLAALLASLAFVAACGDDAPSGPYDDLPVDERITGTDVGAPVDVVRDVHGIPHIRARSVPDLAFAQGYVMASDRIQQMDLFRHFASGRISELFGALDAGQIDGDLEMRMHRFEPNAIATWELLQASEDPEDQELVVFLTRFSDGVNRFLKDLRDGVKTIDPTVLSFFDPMRTADWTPADSLVIGRLQAYSLSYSTVELDLTELLERATLNFDQSADPDRLRRAGAAFDLVRLQPIDVTATTDGFPTAAASAAARPRTPRPHVDPALLARARSVMKRPSLGSKLLDTRNGSNNWVVGPDLAGGKTLLANDPHLQLASPSIFWACHLSMIGDDPIDVAGITFPGIPGIILGHNQHVAWGATTVNHDVNDFYAEDVHPCGSGGGDCVTFEGDEVELETQVERIDIGALGTITSTRTVTYERVPHHGPIVPEIVDGELAPRQDGPAISVRYTGHEPTFELAAFQALWRAADVTEAKAAFASFGFGAQNWVITDDAGHIGWTTQAHIPWRTDGCFTFDPADPLAGGVAPWWVVPADGSCEWDGYMEAEHIPQEVDPARGYIATANNDPIGASADANPLNEGSAGGHRLYVGFADYDEGYRVGRITRRIEAAIDAGDLDADTMKSIQADAYSNLGATLTPHLIAAIDALAAEVATPGTHPDLAAFGASLTPARRNRLTEARALLAGWSFDTPADDSEDSTATVVFNLYAVEVLQRALGDEASVVARGAGGFANTLVTIFEHPDRLHTGLAVETGEPLLCDNLGTVGTIESCTLIELEALDAALTFGVDELGNDLLGWRWGDLHTLTLSSLLPTDELSVPPPNDPVIPDGYPRHGDNFSVDASSPGLGDTEFSYDHGPAMRHVTVLGDEQPVTYLALPGGQQMDTRSSHWRDLMDGYWSTNEYFEVPWTTTQIHAAHESRWVVSP